MGFPTPPPPEMAPSPMPTSAEDALANAEDVLAQAVAREKVTAEVRDHYTKSREQRRRHEGTWFLNGSFLRGNQHVEYNESLGKLTTAPTPSYRVTLDLNRIRPKIRARLSKYFKSRPKPTVLPASTDYTDLLNARATEKVLTYQWDRLRLEEKYKDARLWASIGAKSYWWFSTTPNHTVRVKVGDQVQPLEGQHDVVVEVGSPFEVLVADPAIMRLGDQPWIQRVRMIEREDAVQRFPDLAESLNNADSGRKDQHISPYVDRLATLKGQSPASGANISRGPSVLMIEEFLAPCAKYPKGRYVTLVNDQLAKMADELPYGMWDHPSNPYPCVDFTDTLTPGQFWGTTFIEQMIDVQRQFNFLFELLTENARMCARPKVLVYTQHRLQDGAWTNAPGEVVELNWINGLPPPQILQAQNISGDVWNLINFYDRLFDEITQIYPAAEGQVAASTSGFQTNLLQEATDTVHAPDVREDELTLQEAAWKIRRLCKLAYEVPRLLTIGGGNSLAEMLEFGRENIDEYAEVRIQAGSMLPDLKAARNQTAMELHKSGLLGDPADPLVRRRVLNLIDMGGLEAIHEEDRADMDKALLEQQSLANSQPVRAAEFTQDHVVHISKHQAFVNSAAFDALPNEAKQATIGHLITHYDWVNPTLSVGLRAQYGFDLQTLPLATPAPLPPPPGVAPDSGGMMPPPGVAPAAPAPPAPPPQ